MLWQFLFCPLKKRLPEFNGPFLALALYMIIFFFCFPFAPSLFLLGFILHHASTSKHTSNISDIDFGLLTKTHGSSVAHR